MKSRPTPAVEPLEERPLLAATFAASAADVGAGNASAANALIVTLEPIYAAADRPVSENASLLAPHAHVQAGAITATLDWGDGQTSFGTIVSGDDGNSVIEFVHTYNQAGTYPLRLRVVDSATGATVTQTGASEISAGNSAGPTGVPIPQDPGPITAPPSPTVLTAAGGSAGTVENVPSALEALFAPSVESNGSRRHSANDPGRHPSSARRLLNREAQHHRIAHAHTRASGPGTNRR